MSFQGNTDPPPRINGGRVPIWGHHPVVTPSEDRPVNIEMSPQTLLKDDGTLVLQHSDFDTLNSYLVASRNSPLDGQIGTAYDFLANKDGVFITGKWYQFPVDQLKADLLKVLQDAQAQYRDMVTICNTLIATAPHIPTLCNGIKAFSTHAAANYGQLFDDLTALNADRDNDAKREDAARILDQSRAMIGQLHDECQIVVDALMHFDDNSRSKESDMLHSLDGIQQKSGPTKHHWDIDDIRAADMVHDHGIVTKNLTDEIAHLNDQWRIAVQSAERLQGGWLAVDNDLANIGKALDRPQLFSENKVILRIDRDKIVEKWTAVGAEVDKLIGANDAGRVYGYTTPR